MRTSLVADHRSVLSAAADVGLDPGRQLQDMNSPQVQSELDRASALADVFGVVGTPGLVVEHTVIEGAVPVSLLRRVVADGLSSALPAC